MLAEVESAGAVGDDARHEIRRVVAVERGVAVEVAVQGELGGNRDSNQQSDVREAGGREPTSQGRDVGHPVPGPEPQQRQQEADPDAEHEVRGVGGDGPEGERRERPAFAARERLACEDQEIDGEVKQRAEDVRHGQRDVPTDAGEQAEQRNQDEKGGGESARGALRKDAAEREPKHPGGKQRLPYNDGPGSEVPVEGKDAERVELGAHGWIALGRVAEQNARQRTAIAQVADGVGVHKRIAVEDGRPQHQQRAGSDCQPATDSCRNLHAMRVYAGSHISKARCSPRDVGHPAVVALRSAMEQVREVPANETEQHGCDDQRADQPGVLLEPGAVEFGFEGVVLFGVIRVVVNRERVVGLNLGRRTENAAVGGSVHLVGKGHHVVGEIGIHTSGVELIALASVGAAGDLGLGLEPVVGKVFAESLLDGRDGHGRILAWTAPSTTLNPCFWHPPCCNW